jgi:hypothetical protein
MKLRIKERNWWHFEESIGAMEVATIAKKCKVGTTYKAHQQQVSSF